MVVYEFKFFLTRRFIKLKAGNFLCVINVIFVTYYSLKMEAPLPHVDDAVKFGKDFTIGAAAAVIAKAIVAPIERVKLILQVSVQDFPKKAAIWSFFGESFSKNFLQNDSLGVFLCEKSIAHIENP
jgi:hypothetical protein